MIRPLPFDVERCTGQLDYSTLCPERHDCARFLSREQWDRGNVPHYQPIPVSIAVTNCNKKIEVTR